MIKYRMLIGWAIDKYTEVIILAKDKAEAEKKADEIIMMLSRRRRSNSSQNEGNKE